MSEKKEETNVEETGLQKKEQNLQVSQLADIETAEKVATKLKDLIISQNLYTNIKGKNYVNVEGWNTLGAMLGVFPEVVSLESVNENLKNNEMKYKAEVILKSIQGNIISRGFGYCSNQERNWKGRDEYAIASMAQTRATGKAFRTAFSWIIKLAGYEPTPAEEKEGFGGVKEKKSAKKDEPDLPTVDIDENN